MSILNRATTNPPTKPADPLEAALDSIRKPARLVLAEKNLKATRDRREEAAARLRVACLDAKAAGRHQDEAVTRLQILLDDIDQRIGVEHRELVAQRDLFAPVFRDAIADFDRNDGHDALRILALAGAIHRRRVQIKKFADRLGIDHPAPQIFSAVDAAQVRSIARRLGVGEMEE